MSESVLTTRKRPSGPLNPGRHPGRRRPPAGWAALCLRRRPADTPAIPQTPCKQPSAGPEVLRTVPAPGGRPRLLLWRRAALAPGASPLVTPAEPARRGRARHFLPARKKGRRVGARSSRLRPRRKREAKRTWYFSRQCSSQSLKEAEGVRQHPRHLST